MKYVFDSQEFHSLLSGIGEETDDFFDWIQGTDKAFFIGREKSEYFSYVETIETDHYADYKRGYQAYLCIIQCNETKEYYGFEYTIYSSCGSIESGEWEKYDRVKTRPVVYKYKKVS
jgi:hypothetical protein